MDFLDFVKEAEGTAGQPNPYDTVLGYGRYGTPSKPLTQMTLDEVYDFGRTMLAHPDNHFNSSAAGAFQIVGKTLRDLQSQLNLPGHTLFDEATQDRMAHTLMARRGNDVEGLRNEWEGLRNRSDLEILNALDGAAQGNVSAMMRPMRRPQNLREMATGMGGLTRSPRPPARPAEWDGRGPFLADKHQELASLPMLHSLATQTTKGN